MILKGKRAFAALACLSVFAHAGHAEMSPDKAEALEAVVEFRKSFLEGRLADTLAMSAQCVLAAQAKAKGMTVEGLIEARKEETSTFRLLASSNNYLFQSDVSRQQVQEVAGGLKLFKFNATLQLGPIMPATQTRLIALNDGGGWSITEAKSPEDRKRLADCYAGLKPSDLK